MDGRFTDEELAIAKSVDLCAVAESLGYTVKRIGKYHTLKEMDSIRIYNRSHWYRWSRQFDKGNNGGLSSEEHRPMTSAAYLMPVGFGSQNIALCKGAN